MSPKSMTKTRAAAAAGMVAIAAVPIAMAAWQAQDGGARLAFSSEGRIASLGRHAGDVSVADARPTLVLDEMLIVGDLASMPLPVAALDDVTPPQRTCADWRTLAAGPLARATGPLLVRVCEGLEPDEHPPPGPP